MLQEEGQNQIMTMVMVSIPPHWPRCREGQVSPPGSLHLHSRLHRKDSSLSVPLPPHTEPSPLYRNDRGGEEPGPLFKARCQGKLD